MSDYLPQFKPGQTVTFTASAAVKGGQCVEVTGDRRVAATSGASTKYIGVAGHSAAAESKVVVHLRGHVQLVKAKGAVTAGQHVVTAVDGCVAANETNPIGLAITGGTDGTLIQIAD
ncbi:capsid cement protein [Collinsella sp. LCP21S3_D3]|uniref:capsid cement protein n=1 Tax=Collinsella sp. LCP21S3_D3 TaxID=3438773 RepID=UPI003F92C784